MIGPRAHTCSGLFPAKPPRAPALPSLRLRHVDFSSVAAAPSDELRDIRECLSDLITIQRRIADELRRRAARSTSPAQLEPFLAPLMRSIAGLREAVEAEPAVSPETLCWQCNRPIVRGRLADPPDVVRHMATCAPRIG